MSATVLRVLNGRLSGTERAIAVPGTVSIGHQYWQDVVLRDPATKGHAVDLTLDAEGHASLAVLEGQVALLGSTVEAGATALLPAYVPFEIGGIAVAWGEADSPRWSEATGLVTVAPPAPVAPPSVRDEALATVERAGDRIGAALTPRRLWIAAAVFAAVLLAIFAYPIADFFGLRGTPQERVQRALAERGVTGLAVEPVAGSKRVTVSGVVADPARRVRVTEALRDSDVEGNVAVRTRAELAAAAVDVARLRRIRAVGRPIGRDGVFLRITPVDPATRQKLVAAIHADVSYLRRLELREDLPPVELAPVRTVQDLTKKVSTVVSGVPSYIQTADGARYFAGAMMPSGHTLVSIEGNTIVLEKGGQQTRLTF